MADTKSELVAEIVAYSGEISSAINNVDLLARELEQAEEHVANIKSKIADKKAKLERAQTLLETTAIQLAELQKTEGGR